MQIEHHYLSRLQSGFDSANVKVEMQTPDVYCIGGPLTIDESKAALQNIVPPLWRQRLRGQDARMVEGIQRHLPVWFEHEVNRARGLAFTSNADEGFTHGRS